MAHDVFISYSTKDKPYADAICAGLEAAGIRCWIAPRDILAGVDWQEAIMDAIAGSTLMVLVFSSNANSSSDVRREISHAAEREIPIVPVRIEDARPQGTMKFYLANPHWLDAMTPPVQRHIARIVQTVQQLLARTSAHGAGGDAHEDAPRERAATPSAFAALRSRPVALGALAVGIVAAIVLGWLALPRSVRVVATVPLDSALVGPRIAIDGSLNRIYVSGGAGANQRVTVVDGRTHEARVIGLGSGTSVDPHTHWYWSAGVYSGEVIVRDGRDDHEIGRVPVPGCPHDTAMDVDRVWIASQCDDHVAVVDNQTLRPVTGPIRVPADAQGRSVMGDIIVNPTTRVAYITTNETSHRVDPQSFALRRLPFHSVLAVNETRNRLYTVADSAVRVVDGDTERVITEVRLPATPTSAAVGFDGAKVYIATSQGIAVLDGGTDRRLFVMPLGAGFQPDAIAADAVRNKLYVVGTSSGAPVLKVVCADARRWTPLGKRSC